MHPNKQHRIKQLTAWIEQAEDSYRHNELFQPRKPPCGALRQKLLRKWREELAELLSSATQGRE